MPVAYLDTSAAMKLIVNEQHSTVLVKALLSDPSRSLVSSWLLYTELHCAVARRSAELSVERVTVVLDRVQLVDLTRHDLLAGATLAPLRTADAIHLAAAMRIEADEMITYDAELAAAAVRIGMHVLAPGAA